MFKKSLGVAILLTICYFPLFFHLDSLPIQIYDESRLAVNAVKMVNNSNFLVPYFGNEPDLWNTKPPLMVWLQVFSYKIFGINELGVRLPAAIAGLFTVLFIGFFCWKKLNRPILGLAAMGVLLTTPGYISTHVTRTGDYDSLLILFTVLFLFTFFRFVHSDENKERQKLLFFSAIWLSFAVLTKSIAGLFFLPTAVIYLFWNKQVLKTLKSKNTYLAVGLFLIIVLSYYGLREVYNPGYLKAVWENELGGRYFETLENNNASFNYYLKNIWEGRFKPWLFILPIGLIFGFYEKDAVRNLILFLSISVISYLLIISSANTKLQWYDAPVFPLLAVISALGIEKISELLKTRFKLNQVVFLVILFALPYFLTVRNLYKPVDSNPAQHYGLFMRELTDLKEYTLVHVGYNSHISFYQMMYNKKGCRIKEVWPSKLKAGETAMFCEKEPKRVLKERFQYEILEEGQGCILVKILKKLE